MIVFKYFFKSEYSWFSFSKTFELIMHKIHTGYLFFMCKTFILTFNKVIFLAPEWRHARSFAKHPKYPYSFKDPILRQSPG